MQQHTIICTTIKNNSCFRPDTFDIDGDASSESEREPTTDDFDRVYASGLTAGRVRRFMGAVHAVRYLVPCRLRFSFLADLPAHIAASKFRGGGSGASGSSGGIGSRVAQFRTRRQVQQAAPGLSTPSVGLCVAIGLSGVPSHKRDCLRFSCCRQLQ